METTNSTVSMASAVRKIAIVDGYILYTLKADLGTDYFSDNAVLLDILTLDRLSPFRDDGRLRAKTRKNGTVINFYLYDIAYACYHGFIKSVDSWLDDMKKYIDKKNLQGMQIDHADNNIHNNTVYNLSLMPISFNQSKSNIVSRFKEPLYLNSAFVDNEYRVQIIWNTFVSNLGKGQVTMNLLCDNPECYVNLLKSLSTISPDWHHAIKDKRGWEDNQNSCWSSEIRNSLKAQQHLANMGRAEFDFYEKDHLCETLSIKEIQDMIIVN